MTYLLLKIDQGHQDKKLVPRLVDVILKYGVIRSSGLLSRDKNVFLHGHDASFSPFLCSDGAKFGWFGVPEVKMLFSHMFELIDPNDLHIIQIRSRSYRDKIL